MDFIQSHFNMFWKGSGGGKSWVLDLFSIAVGYNKNIK